MAKKDDMDFINLLSRVEKQGGEHSERVCSQTIYDSEHDAGQHAQGKRIIAGCGATTYLKVPYDPYADVWVDEPVLVPHPKRENCHISQKKAVKGPDGNWFDQVVTKRVLRKGEPAKKKTGEKRIIEVCAHHDSVFDWPRFLEES